MAEYAPIDEWFDGQQAVLDNGLTIWTKGSPEAKKYALMIAVKAGSVEDPLGQPGLAHCFEHIPFRGAGRFTSGKQITSPLEEWDGKVGAYTTLDHTAFHVVAHPQTRDHAIEALCAMVTQPHFEGVAIERESILREYHDRRSSALGEAGMELLPLCFADPTWGRTVIGTPESILGMTAGHLQRFHTQWYTADQMIATFVGPESDQVLLELIAEHLAHIPRGPCPPNQLQPSPAFNCGRQQVRWDRSEAVVCWEAGWPFSMADSLCSNLHMLLLGAGSSSPLFQELREQRGYFYSFDFDVQTWRGALNPCFDAQVSAARVEKFWDDFWKVFDPAALSVERLTWAKHRVYAEESGRNFSPRFVANRAMTDLLQYGRVWPRNEIVRLALQIDLEQMRELMTMHYVPDRSLQVSFLPAACCLTSVPSATTSSRRVF